MKAKEYYERFKESQKDAVPALIDIFIEMAREVRKISVMRKSDSDQAMLGIFREQDRKAKALIRRINKDGHGIKVNAFEIFLRDQLPKIAPHIYNDHEQTRPINLTPKITRNGNHHTENRNLS